jgi:phosphoribosyl 1,2-cyclic phosphate phosphodiesterase
LDVVKRNLPYVFSPNPYPGAPQINLNEINDFNASFNLAGLDILPVRAYHHRLPVLGYRIGNFAYLTDISHIEDAECVKLENLDILVLVALRQFTHPAHLMLSESLELIEKLKPKKTYLIHMSHDMGLHEDVQNDLPENVFLSWDGLEVELY